VGGEEDVAFQGRKIRRDDDQHLTAYLTPKSNIAVVDKSGKLLDVYDECEAFLDDYGTATRPGTQQIGARGG
jgi:hypothetical protein